MGLFPQLTIYQEVPCVGTRMRLDLYVHELKLAFEFDGEQHEEFNPFLHGTKRRFLEAKNRDFQKEEWCRINGIRLIRVKKEDLGSVQELISERD